MKLTDLWTGKLTVRRASVLALHLPPDAAVWRIGPDDHLWSREVQATVTLMDGIRSLFDSNAVPLPRPGDTIRQENKVDRILSKADRWLERHGNK